MDRRISVTLRWAGRVWEIAEQLDVDWSASVPIASGGATWPAEVSLTVDLGVDVAELVARGHDLSQMEGELHLDGRRVMRGRARAPVYGDPTEPPGIVRLTLRQAVSDDSALYPDAHAVISPRTWPDSPEESHGSVYPQIWGAPGRGLCAGSPAHLLAGPPVSSGPQHALIAGHAVASSTVIVIAPDLEVAATLPVVHIQDSRGRTVAVVDLYDTAIDSGGTVDLEAGLELWVCWTTPARSGLAGDVVAELLALSSGRIDWGRAAVAVEALNQYRLDFYLDERVRPHGWIGDNLMPILPLTLAMGPDGEYPVVWRRATREGAVAHLVVGGPDCVATSPIRYVGDPVNDVVLKYTYRADTEDYLGIAVADEETHPDCERSQVRYHGDEHDGRYATVLETDVVYDDPTADLICSAYVARYAMRSRTVGLWLDRRIWGHVREGDEVTVTDSARHLDRVPAWVERRVDSEDGVSVAIVLQEAP